ASFYLTRSSFSVAKVALPFASGVSLTRDDLGLIDSVLLTFYMLGQFLFGPLGDRFGPRGILICGLGLSAAAAIGSGFSTTLAAFIVFSMLQGIAQSTGWSNTNKAMSSWFSVNERGRVIGWWCTHYTVGSAVALPFAGWMMDHFGHARFASFPLPVALVAAPNAPYVPTAVWAPTLYFSTVAPYWPGAFWGPAGAVAGVMVMTWLFLKNRPEDVDLPPIEDYHQDSVQKESQRSTTENAIINEEEGSWRLIASVMVAPRMWTLALAYFSVKLVRYAFIFWGPKYVAETIHSGALESTVVAAAMPVGGLVGVIGCGYVSDKLFQARRAPVAVLSLLACAAVMVCALIETHNPWIMAAFFFLVGAFIFGPDSLIASTASIDFGTKRGAGTSVGFVNGIGSIGGILGGWLPGRITTGTNWAPLFVVMLLGLIASAAMLVPLWRVKASTD
ncbi:MAG TPA: MFS transporter, partial [Lacipirellulaceae bacterium]|nr:MFS transporter [Lacipirellulaceae bacterium]